ncbi:MAG: O-acetyl-ADP-ribose deacetylase [Chloroflexi bacterium]|jgi:O-acetyl-ADP-ribose deacetylase|nr:O-acetyl-ADP-ribose deacetylase [Chloroflexota bacterium]MBT7081084.1 O-acetyl-ADP-ribose deacetylase [Chloroflexota bacterium]MBT7289479.1 O-acetyl-ADP-ribose deacetylase [Chloroflexota bacterium]
MEAIINQTIIRVIQDDITKQSTDAIVNAANSSLMGGGGVDGAIHRAGGSAILAECKKIVALQGRLPTGQAVITSGGNLLARHVIHTVGPIWGGGNNNEADLLASAYTKSLELAASHNLASISFPSISTGAYRYPLQQAAMVAIKAIISFINTFVSSLREVVIVAFGLSAAEAYKTSLSKAIKG